MIFVFGNASFQGGTLGWTALESWLVASLKSLGFLVVFEDEAYTSQKCPCCKKQTEYQGLGIRIKYCRQFHVFFHRDTMASQNIANRAYSIHNGTGIPEQFLYPNQKNDQDGNNNGKGIFVFIYHGFNMNQTYSFKKCRHK